MKRKIFKVLACVLVLSIVMIGLVACVKDKDKPKDDTKNVTVDITMLPDMIDYGQSAYYNIAKVDYTSDFDRWDDALNKKLDEEHDNWLLTGETWDNGNYYSFGAITGEGDSARRQHRFGYLAQDDGAYYWEDSDSANTVERIFCYSTPADFLNVLSEQGIKAAYTEGMVEYITRDDSAYNDREEYYDYEFTIGEGSALQDYRELEELEEIYNDWDENEIAEKSAFANSDEVSDAVNLKNRKISGEVFNIFGDAGDQFALTAIALLEYSTYVVENVMIPAYEAEFAKIATDETEYDDLVNLDEEIDKGKMAYLEGGDTTGDYADYKKLINYMREEMYDYDTLSYFLSFREYADMPIVDSATSAEAYEVGNMAEPMTLFGYHYQFRHRDYNFYDTDETYTFRNATSIVDGSQNLSMYEYFLKLGHESYFASSGTGANVRISSEDEKYALDYRRIDRDHYEQAYRYTTACLTKYYEAQLDFQVFQERMDVDLYVGGDNGKGTVLYKQGIGYAKQEPDQNYIQGDTKTYSEEMYNALGSNGSALDSNLKISDVNWEYTADDTITKRFNLVSARWLSIEDNATLTSQEKLLKVEYEIELLKSQNNTLNHGYMKDSDFTHALQYEIYSYSADSVRGIQQNKKNNVIYAKDAARMKAVVNSATTGYDIALAELEENVGRNRAEYANLDRNYADSNVTSEINLSGSADWTGVRSNVAETLKEDYAGYVAKGGNDVDEHFEKTLIKQIYVCKSSAADAGQRGGTEDHCLVNGGNNHSPYCEEDYDTTWALSRLVNNHETSLRYMYGQSEVTFARMDISALEKDNADIAGNKFNAGSKYFIIEGNSVRTEMVDTDEEIGSVLRDSNGALINLPTYGTGANVNGNEFSITVNNVTYNVKFDGWFVDPELKYEVLEDEEYNYDIVLYPAYSIRTIG